MWLQAVGLWLALPSPWSADSPASLGQSSGEQGLPAWLGRRGTEAGEGCNRLYGCPSGHGHVSGLTAPLLSCKPSPLGGREQTLQSLTIEGPKQNQEAGGTGLEPSLWDCHRPLEDSSGETLPLAIAQVQLHPGACTKRR